MRRLVVLVLVVAAWAMDEEGERWRKGPEMKTGLLEADELRQAVVEIEGWTDASEEEDASEDEAKSLMRAETPRVISYELKEKIPRSQLPPRDPPIRFRKNVPDYWIALELTEGKNRQVRRMTAAVGHPTLRLLRVKIGRLELGGLPVGEWREVPPDQRALLFADGARHPL